MINTLDLLKTRKFLPLFITQMFNALNDNILRSSITAFITFQLLDNDSIRSNFWTSIATAMFILPTLLFSSIAGDLADKYKKVTILRSVKVAELLIVLVTSVLLFGDATSPSSLMLCVFLMGTHAAVFSPAKFSYLPEYLESDELLPANGLIEGSTFIAIAMGVSLGSLVGISSLGVSFISTTLFALSISGLIASFIIPSNRAQNPDIKVRKNFISATQQQIESVHQHDNIWLPIIGISWFWVTATIYSANLINYVQFNLHANLSVFALLNTIFTIGIGIGSLTCNKIMKGAIHTRLVPISLFTTSVFGLHLFYSTGSIISGNELASVGSFLSSFHSYSIMFDLLMISIAAGIYVVPLYAILQKNSPLEKCARIMAATNVINALFMILATIASFIFLTILKLSVISLYLTLALVNLTLSIYLCKMLPLSSIKPYAAKVVAWLFSVQVSGLEHFQASGKRVVVICNHITFIDTIFLTLFLPGQYIFAVNTDIAKLWIVRFIRNFVECHEIDPTNPIRTKTIAKRIEKGQPCIIFPEGRLTNTGNIMKVYSGPVAIAEWADANIIPVNLGGDLKFNIFSRLKGIFKLRLFTPVTITVLPVFKLQPGADNISSKERRELHVQQIYEKMVQSSYIGHDRRDLYSELRHATVNHGGSHVILEDFTRKQLTYRSLLLKTQILGKALLQDTQDESYIGVLLPNTSTCAVTVLALHAYRKVPAMINYTAGASAMAASCVTSNIKILITSRQFIAKAELTDELKAMRKHLKQVIFLEDIAKQISTLDKISGALRYLTLDRFYRNNPQYVPHIDAPAVVLFTSGSEGTPKGVVLSHRNITANKIQSLALMDLNPLDSMFNALPMFHAFGFTLGTLTPIMCGIKTFLYPNPKQFSTVVDFVYDTRSTILIGTNTFLNAYLKVSTPYDFAKLRIVFAGGEKLQTDTYDSWLTQRGILILEGYGATEGAPVFSVNTTMHFKPGTVGRLLPGIEYRFNPFPGVTNGGELCVRGENIMLGYLYHDTPGKITPLPNGWYDTGDVVKVDEQGYLTIVDRVKRFAKVSGEMISLSAIENEVAICWPDQRHGVISIQDTRRGEKLVLVTEKQDANRSELAKKLKENGVSPLAVPSQIETIKQIPLLGTGKIDYPKVMNFIKNLPGKAIKGQIKDPSSGEE
ncbi:MFS transporter [Candidatus Comchoanobacter bicostacola]|uniref:MFS transporter n=1 Tax=Candidatus Comchoanobacter bicostacola TaxID=2919598 RepID=A0ABY5DHY2_9GAMM|nr:MFS transporter [Candidatus Comchoanobacter bicostacola]UTC24258.1 MFS transporter [Candidatus Comchoanobacter bicostacola]